MTNEKSVFPFAIRHSSFVILRGFSMRHLFLVLLLLLAATSFADDPKAKKVLFIGLDGTRFDAIEKAKTPNLDALIKEGIYSDTCLILGDRYQKNDTVSGPGW